MIRTRLSGSAENLRTIRYYDDDTPKLKSISKGEEINHPDPETGKNKVQGTRKGFEGRKLTREQMWRNLSQPKHPKTSIKQLREKIESDIKKESWSKTNSLSRVQTLPHLAPESRGLITSVDTSDKNNRSSKSMYLTVPNVIHVSKSDENLAVDSGTFETEEVMRLEHNPPLPISPVFGKNGSGSLLRRKRAKSLVVRGDRSPTDGTTGNELDFRLLVSPEVKHTSSRSGSDSTIEVGLSVPQLKVHAPEKLQ